MLKAEWRVGSGRYRAWCRALAGSGSAMSEDSVGQDQPWLLMQLVGSTGLAKACSRQKAVQW
jgi:hypothetical protein